MRILSEFVSSTKGLPIDEFADLLFYRPLSFILVKLCLPLAVTPNQISFLAMTVGITSGIFFARGTHMGFLLGGLFCSLANILDCSDGMLARMKSKGTLTGRIVDGIGGHVFMAAVYTGFGIGLLRAQNNGLIELPFHPLLLAGLAGVSHLIHAGLSDYYACLYSTHVLGQHLTPQSEIQIFNKELERLKPAKGKLLERVIIRLYILYNRFQLGTNPRPFVRYDSAEYKKYNQVMVILWNLVGPSLHIFVLFISSLLFKPMVFFYYTIIFGNLWILILFPIQAEVNRKMTPLPSSP